MDGMAYVGKGKRCLTSTEAIRLIRDGKMGGRGYGGEVKEHGA